MQKINLSSHRKKIIGLVMLFVAILLPFLKYNFKFSVYIDVFYVIYLACLIITNSDTKEPIIGALILLIITPLLLISKKGNFANVVAIGAYYLLVIGVLAQLVDFIKENRKNAKAKKR